MTRTKLLGLALGLAGILMLGATLLPLVGAQEKPGSNLYPGGGSSPGMQPGGAPGNARTSITAAWEYKYVIRRSNRLEEFQKALASYAGDGWEYVGTESDLGADGGPVMVFKRPAAHGRNAPGGGMPGMMGPGVGGPGIGGPSMGMPGLGAPGMGGGLLGGSGLGGGALGIGGGFAGNPGGGQNSKATQKSGGIQGFSGGAPMGGAMKPGSLGKDQGIATGRDVQIIALRNASAVSLAKSLLELFGDGTARIVAEQQTNSLLVQADAETYQLIVKLVERLDVMPKRQ